MSYNLMLAQITAITLGVGGLSLAAKKYASINYQEPIQEETRVINKVSRIR